MSITYGGREGFAVVIDKNEWRNLWNKNHPGKELGEEDIPEEVDWSFGAWDDGNAMSFDITTPGEFPDAFDADLGKFGTALDGDPEKYDPFAGPVYVMFAPKEPDYFKPAYSGIDEMVADFIGNSDVLAAGDEQFVIDHLGYVGVVSYG